jgi:hypothetical protein
MRRVLFTFLALGLLAAGCAEARDERAKVADFLLNSESVSREFVYTVKDGNELVEVRGEIADSFRFRALVRLDGVEVAEVIIDDDALALRAINPAKIPQLASLGSSQIVSDTLNAGQWVVDPSGAPPLNLALSEKAQAQDVIQDAANALRYARVALGEAAQVKEWREEDLEPAFRPSEDRFPKPRSATLRRYDLVRPAVPQPTQELGSLEAQPTTSMFRRMVIYVSGNRAVRVLEQIDIDGHPDFVEARKERKKRMLEFLDAIKRLQGTQQINEREMSLTLRSLGKSTEIRQPADALRASLKGFFTGAAAGGGGELPEEGADGGEVIPAPEASPAPAE